MTFFLLQWYPNNVDSDKVPMFSSDENKCIGFWALYFVVNENFSKKNKSI